MARGLQYIKDNPAYAKYKIGAYSYGNPIVRDWGHAGITLEIGSFCSIARGVEIFLGGEHKTGHITTFPLNHALGYDTDRANKHLYEQEHAKGSVIIGNDVWIGADAFILSGTTIGDGAIIGAKSVVSGNVPPYSVSVGNPCKHRRFRFSTTQISSLLEIRWWNWPIDRIRENTPWLLSGNIDDFIRRNLP